MKRFYVSTVAIAVLCGLASSAVAQGESARTRAEVVAETRAAAAAGQLIPGRPTERGAFRSTLTQSDVKQLTLMARSDGMLVPPGEGLREPRLAVRSSLARADVKEDVRQAARDRELAPAGDAYDSMTFASRKAESAANYASNRVRGGKRSPAQ